MRKKLLFVFCFLYFILHYIVNKIFYWLSLKSSISGSIYKDNTLKTIKQKEITAQIPNNNLLIMKPKNNNVKIKAQAQIANNSMYK